MRAASLAAAAAGSAALLAGAAWMAWQAHQRGIQVERGRALFHGEVAVPGTLEGHDTALPVLATRCANCHEASNAAPLGAEVAAVTGGAGAGTFATPLDRAHLSARKPRRGGPPSAYQPAQFCVLLRTGVDPAQIIVRTIMPRYDISDAQCADLWAYVESR
jgi:hypothetical protein